MAFFQKQLGRLRWTDPSQGSLLEGGIKVKHFRQFSEECGLWLPPDFPERNGTKEQELWMGLTYLQCRMVLAWVALKLGQDLTLPDKLTEKDLEHAGMGTIDSRGFWTTENTHQLRTKALLPLLQRKQGELEMPVVWNPHERSEVDLDQTDPVEFESMVRNLYLDQTGVGEDFFYVVSSWYNRRGKRKAAIRAKICSQLSRYNGKNLPEILDGIEALY